MGEAYQQKYAGLLGNDRRALIESQRRWIASRNAQCNQTELPEAKSCILQFTKARLATFEQQVGQPLQLVAPSVVPSAQAGTRGALTSAVAAGQFEDGRAALKRGDYVNALRLLNPLAEQGLAPAQNILGVMYATGTGVPKDDSEAVYWLRKAADQGIANAQMLLGTMYLSGRGVPENAVEAAKWLREAAEQGDALAEGTLGDLYSFGMHGVPLDYAESMKWLRKAADQRNADAMESLGDHYAHGYGVPSDSVEAAKWYRMAADQKHADAQKNLGDMLATGQGRPQAKSKESESGATSGTAFFVSKDGAALTNAHVVDRCQQIRVSINGQQGTARVVGRDDKNDLALLETDLHPAQSADWRLSVRQGEDIVIYGFPLTGVLAAGGNVATGNVTALAGLGNDSRFLQISAPVQPGNSGGPLLDRNGNVVGIVVAKLNALGIASATGDIPQNVNFAIKASVAAAFLDTQGVVRAEGQDTASPAAADDPFANLPRPDPQTSTLSTPDLSERAKAFTAQVVCLR